MPSETSQKISRQVIDIALSFGASMAGIADINLLQKAPSYELYGPVHWPQDANSVVVLALYHPIDKPELDWWYEEGGSEGDRRLIEISRSLQQWLEEQHSLKAVPLPYSVDNGGIFLKDAAVMAGLGVIGLNNLLITPDFGPKVRLRALFINSELAPTNSTDFAPCVSCKKPCLSVCPQDAFTNGQYHRDACIRQMDQDIAAKRISTNNNEGISKVQIKYCRACEFACVFST